jgi:hypothetical protein
MLATRGLSILIIALAVLMTFATATQQHIPTDRTTVQLQHANPGIVQFQIEDLSPSEWQAEHKRVRDALGDEAYLALRKSEIDEKMESSNAILNDMIKAGQWKFPRIPAERSVKPTRLGLKGRVFNAGVAQGVPEHITDAMYAMFNVDADDREIPEEWLEFAIPAAELEDEKNRREEERQNAVGMEDLEILNGSYSVRNIDVGCFFGLGST